MYDRNFQKKSSKGKEVEKSFCDFCKSKTNNLVKTGKTRYNIDYKSYGKEAICRNCLNAMR